MHKPALFNHTPLFAQTEHQFCVNMWLYLCEDSFPLSQHSPLAFPLLFVKSHLWCGASAQSSLRLWSPYTRSTSDESQLQTINKCWSVDAKTLFVSPSFLTPACAATSPPLLIRSTAVKTPHEREMTRSNGGRPPPTHTARRVQPHTHTHQ